MRFMTASIALGVSKSSANAARTLAFVDASLTNREGIYNCRKSVVENSNHTILKKEMCLILNRQDKVWMDYNIL